MPIVDLQYKAGTQAAPQNTESSDARWIATSGVHFPDDNLTPIPSFSESIGDLPLQGTCRAQWAGRLGGSSSIAGAYYLFGTHSHLFAEYRATRYNITPFAGQSNITLGSNPLNVHSGDATMTIDIIAHGLLVGDSITLSGASDVDSINANTYINISHIVASVPNADSVTVELGIAAGSTATGGGDFIQARTIAGGINLSAALDTTAASSIITVNYTAHGLSDSSRIKLTGFALTDGIPASEINAEHIVTLVDVDSFTITVDTNASAGGTGGGGTDGFIFKPMVSGFENQTFFSGYGAGLYGAGAYGTNRVSTITPAFPRIASFDNFGNRYIYCAGDYSAGDGQKIYEWDGDKDFAPTPVLDAPENCNWFAVIANQIVALCGTNIIIALTDPTTGIAQWPTVPSTSPIGDVIPVQRSTRLLSIAPIGEKSGIVFAPDPLLLRLVGGVWDLIELGAEYPIAAPSAWCRFQDGVIWYAQDGNYYFCNGGAVRKITNRQNGEFVRDDVNQDAIWTMFMMPDQKHNQVWLYYPSGSSVNPDKYVIFNPDNESFTLGEQTRTSGQRPSIVDQRFYMANTNEIYNSFTTDATNFNWSAQTAYFYFDTESRWKLTRLWPDSVITGTVNIRILGKEHAQDDPIDYGTYTMDSNTTSMTVRAASRLISLEFSGNEGFTLPKLKMNLNRMGRRRV